MPLGVRTIQAKQLRIGMWLVHDNERQNQRVVDVQAAPRDDQVKVYADYGNGGEPATLFFDDDELVSVVG